MRLIKAFVFWIGVTLSVAPIFTSALAQQANTEARLLLEIEALRIEIAELRDMIERQQYELRRLQRAQQSRPAAVIPSAPQNPVIGGAATGVPVTGGSIAGSPLPLPATQAEQPFDPAAQPAEEPLNPLVGSVPRMQSGAEVPSPVVAAQPQANDFPVSTIPRSGPQSNNDFYRPADAGDAPVVASANQIPGTNRVAIEERVISASPPPAGQMPADSGVAPVEERLVGTGRVAQPEAIAPAVGDVGELQPDFQINPAPVVTDQVIDTAPPTTLGGPVSTPPATAGGGIVAIPSEVTMAPPTQPVRPAPSTAGVPVGTAVDSAAVDATGQVPGQPQPVSRSTVSAPQPAPVLSEDELYQQGFNLLKQGRQQEAVDVFKQQITAHPSGELVDDAHYWIAESSYVNRQLDTSKLYFRTIIDRYPQSARVPDAMLKTAYIEQQQGNQIEARILLQEIIQYHPRSNAAISAKNRLAALDEQIN